MENWGLITYREAALLYEEGVSSPLDKQAVAHLIARELAHQVIARATPNKISIIIRNKFQAPTCSVFVGSGLEIW